MSAAKIVEWFFSLFRMPPKPEIQPVETPPTPTPTPVPAQPKYLWDTTINARHSLRLICDEEGLTLFQKNRMSQVVNCESGYNIHAKHVNKGSTDYGICQWNDYWHAKEITPDEAENNPEKAVRLMCQYVKAGEIKQWVCYSRGYFQKYSA